MRKPRRRADERGDDAFGDPAGAPRALPVGHDVRQGVEVDRGGHAEALAAKPTLLLRYTRLMFTENLKKRMQDLLGYGLAMEGLALMEQIDPPK